MKTMAYYFFKWHSRVQVLQASSFSPCQGHREQRGRQQRQANRPLLTLHSGDTLPRAGPRSRLFWSSKTGSFSRRSRKRLAQPRAGGGPFAAAFPVSPLTAQRGRRSPARPEPAARSPGTRGAQPGLPRHTRTWVGKQRFWRPQLWHDDLVNFLTYLAIFR